MQRCERMWGELGQSLWAELGNKEFRVFFFFFFSFTAQCVFWSYYNFGHFPLSIYSIRSHCGLEVNSRNIMTRLTHLPDCTFHSSWSTCICCIFLSTVHTILYYTLYINAPSMVHSGHFICLAKASTGLTVAQYTTYVTREHYPSLHIYICCSRSNRKVSFMLHSSGLWKITLGD